jgi:hypothetical protein
MNDLKALEEMVDLSIDDYNNIKEKFIKDAEVNFEIYRNDLMYLNALDILKASEFAINTFRKYSLAILQVKNNITHQEINKVVENAIKYEKEISKELRDTYNNSTERETPKDLKTKTDELIRSLK